jgi:hypothetical protein
MAAMGPKLAESKAARRAARRWFPSIDRLPGFDPSRSAKPGMIPSISARRIHASGRSGDDVMRGSA